MSSSSIPSRQPSASIAVATVALLLVVAVGTVIGHRVDSADETAETRARSTAQDVAIALTAAEGSAERKLSALAQQFSRAAPADLLRRTSVPGVGALTWVTDSGRTRRASAGALAVDVSDPAFATAAVRARDRGEAVLSAPPQGWPGPLIVLPLYEIDGTLRTLAPDDSTESRRESLAGYLVGALDVAAVTAPVEVAHWSVADGSTVIAAAGGVRDRSAAASFLIGDRRWTVTVWEDPAFQWAGAIPELLAVVGLGAAGLVGLIVEGRRRRRIRSEVEAERERTAIIADLAQTLQQSLELADVIPIVAVQLSDRFGLSGISVVTSGDDSAAEVFSLGVRPDDSVSPQVELGSHLAQGDTASLALTRGGRLVAELRLRAGRELDSRDLTSIQASAELATSAIVTAQALDRQRLALDQLTELDSIKNVFLTTAAHELRTPVAAIKGFGGLLRDQWEALSDDERRLTASRVAANADGLNLLVQDLLDFSRLETGRLEVHPQPMELAGFVSGIVDRLSGAWAGHDVAVFADPGPEISGDPVALERVVTNLLSNAVRYSPSGTTVTVTVRHERGVAVLTVDDEGPGVPPDERERIFNRFYRGDGRVVLETRGVGIGLAVVKEYVRQLDASVRVADAPSGGARFECRFPHQTRTPTGEPAPAEGAQR